MPFIYTRKEQLSEAELFGKLNTERRGATVPPEQRVSLHAGYAASAELLKQAEPTPLEAMAEQSKQEHPLTLPDYLLPPGSKYRTPKNDLVNPPPKQS